MISTTLTIPTVDLLVVGTAFLTWGVWLLIGAIAEQCAEKRRLRLQQEKWDRVEAHTSEVLKQWGRK